MGGSAELRSRIEALGGDGRRVEAILDHGIGVDRENRRRVAWTVAYPLAVGLVAAMGGIWLAATKVPLIEAMSTLQPGGDPGGSGNAPPLLRSLFWPLTTASLLGTTAAATLLVGLIRTTGKRRLRAAIACELLAELPAGAPGAVEAERLVGDLCGPACMPGRTAGPLLPPLALLALRQPTADGRRRALREVAAFYRTHDELARHDRLQVLPALGLFLAGVAVLAYAAVLFVPLARSLETVAATPTARVQP